MERSKFRGLWIWDKQNAMSWNRQVFRACSKSFVAQVAEIVEEQETPFVSLFEFHFSSRFICFLQGPELGNNIARVSKELQGKKKKQA